MKKVFLSALLALNMIACQSYKCIECVEGMTPICVKEGSETSHYDAWLDITCIKDYIFSEDAGCWIVRYDSDQTFCEEGEVILYVGCDFITSYEHNMSQDQIDEYYAIRVFKDSYDNVTRLVIVDYNN